MIKKFITDFGIKKIEKLFFIDNPIELCKFPYHGHKKGCPNVRKNKNCPPLCKRLEKKYNLSLPCYLVYVKFNLWMQEQRMLFLHPEWTKKQARCLLYWQSSLKKILKEEISLSNYNDYKMDYELIPEAMGLNVFETGNFIGLNIQKNIDEYVYKIAFLGHKIND